MKYELNEQGDEPYQQGIFIDVFPVDRLPLPPEGERVMKDCKELIPELEVGI